MLLPPAVLAPIQAMEGRGDSAPTLADFWAGDARFVVDRAATGLPMGESDTVVRRRGLTLAGWQSQRELWAYIHASARSAGMVDSCGDPVSFPGCVALLHSNDDGRSFALGESPRADGAPVCQIACGECPCSSQFDHIDQQQYPRVAVDAALRAGRGSDKRLHMVYEYRGMVMYRTSWDGALWSHPQFVPGTGVWEAGYQPCPAGAEIGAHPFAETVYDCLVGGPPGLFVEAGQLYIFVGWGQNPGAMGCLTGPASGDASLLVPCATNPLFAAPDAYGPLNRVDAATNPFFGFRTISSADVVRIGEPGDPDTRYYMLYEGVRGPSAGDPGDTQFALGLARSRGSHIDGPWETFTGNPILVDQPGNIGVGHADLTVLDGQTVLFTSLDGETRSRLVLKWAE